MTTPPREPLELSARRRQILDAAVTVLATQGWRGLTHRAIDRAAGLAEGSSSAYYRSRSALQSAMADYVVWQLAADVEALAAELAEATCLSAARPSRRARWPNAWRPRTGRSTRPTA